MERAIHLLRSQIGGGEGGVGQKKHSWSGKLIEIYTIFNPKVGGDPKFQKFCKHSIWMTPSSFFCSIASSASVSEVDALITDEKVCFMSFLWCSLSLSFILISPVSCPHRHVSDDVLYYVTRMNRHIMRDIF